jgi:hypothetical protein
VGGTFDTSGSGFVQVPAFAGLQRGASANCPSDSARSDRSICASSEGRCSDRDNGVGLKSRGDSSGGRSDAALGPRT